MTDGVCTSTGRDILHCMYFCHYHTIPAFTITTQYQLSPLPHNPSFYHYHTIPAFTIITQSLSLLLPIRRYGQCKSCCGRASDIFQDGWARMTHGVWWVIFWNDASDHIELNKISANIRTCNGTGTRCRVFIIK